MREGWEYKKLGEICDIYQPKTISAKEMVENGDYLVYGANGVIGRYYSYNHINSEVLMTCRGATCGTINISKPYSWINGNDMVIHHKNNSITQAFLSYHLKGIDLSDVITGAAQPQITRQSLSPKKIFVPSLSQQKHIVAELDLLSSIIEKKKAQLEEYDQLAQSIFYDMFGDPITNEKGWEVKKLKESVHEMFLGPFGSALKVTCYVPKNEAYAMVYEQKHAIQGTLELENHFVNKEKFDSLARFEVKPKDFIMSCRGTIGRIFQLPKNAPKGIIHPSLMKIRIKEDIYYYSFFVPLLKKIIAEQTTKGNCVQMAITAKELGNMDFILPPLSLQQEFAEKIKAIEKQKELIKQSIAETETLFNSRMDYYFN